MKAKTIRTLTTEPSPLFPNGIMLSGTVIDNPHPPFPAFWLVRMGVAVPADEECEQAHGMTPEQMVEAQRVYPRTEAGIQPEDFHLWDAGVIAGYMPDGTYKPGPNWVDPSAEEEQESDLIFQERQLP